MQLVPQVQPITNMQRNYNHVVSLLDNGPVFLTQRSETTAVLIQPSQWNQLVRELENHRLLAESRRISARNDANDSWVDGEVVEARMRALRESVEN